jgi:hypothetical protein
MFHPMTPALPTMVGFVVFMFNPLNYDVALDIPSGVTLPEVETNMYTFTEDGTTVQKGTTYRCRMVGVLRRKSPPNYEEHRGCVRDLNQKLAMLNGWVKVKIIGVDKYKRLLIEMYDVITGVSFNNELKKYQTLFTEYG